MAESTLNPEQNQAVSHGDGPLMILAGAGSGKTRVLVHRIASLVSRGIVPSRILAVTFSNKAAQEMKIRLRTLLGDAVNWMWVGTFHATCARLLRMHGHLIGLSRDFTIFDDDDQISLLGKLIKAGGYDGIAKPRAVLSAIDRAKNAGKIPHAGHSPAEDLAARLYQPYADALAREKAVDFNDLLLKVLDLGKHPDGHRILTSLFEHVLVDEFQDTNRVQFLLTRLWVQAHDNLTVVGDDDQSIYSWRGADPKHLLYFTDEFPRAHTIKLEQNYRSTKYILQAANGVITNNRERHAKALWTEHQDGELLCWQNCRDERVEASFVAASIRAFALDEGRPFTDFAVLYRGHAQSRAIEEALRLERIDYKIIGGLSFFQRKEVKDIRAYLRLALVPDADSALERVINEPGRGIGKTTVERLRQFARQQGVSMLGACELIASGSDDVGPLLATHNIKIPADFKPAMRKKLSQFAGVIQEIQSVIAQGSSVAETLIQIIDRSGYRLVLQEEGTDEARDRLDLLGELVSMASDFDEEFAGEDPLAEFEQRIALASSIDEEVGPVPRVTLMTIHAAKGLEFPVVFVIGLEENVFPSLRSSGFEQDQKAVEEERRLAYVAFTRAQTRLILTSAQERRLWGKLEFNRVSRFVREIPDECMFGARPRSQSGYRNAGARGREWDDSSDSSHEAGHEATIDMSPEFSNDDFDQRPEWEMRVRRRGVVATSVEVSFSVGSRVRHETFGIGRVIDIRSGREMKILVEFPSAGLKTVISRFLTGLD